MTDKKQCTRLCYLSHPPPKNTATWKSAYGPTTRLKHPTEKRPVRIPSKISFIALCTYLSILSITPAVQAQNTTINTGETVTIPGTYATPWSIGNLYINGAMNIQSSGEVSSTSGHIGYSAGSTGNVTVDGSGSNWTSSGAMYVGNNGAGELTIVNGGTVSNTSAYIGNSAGSSGTVTVDGIGSNWTSSSSLIVGSYGTGILTISNGGTVSNNTSALIGRYSGSTSGVTVDGNGSSWINNGLLYLGDEGTGELIIRNGGTVSNTSATIGRYAGGSGTVTVDGSGSSWTSSGALTVGNYGTGELTISNSGTASNNTSAFVGRYSGSSGTVTVDGISSNWINNGTLDVGYEGTGVLTIRNGGTVSNTTGYIGTEASSSGTVTVDGSDSSWSSSFALSIGHYGTGTLTISNGGTVNNNISTLIGRYPGSSGAVTVDGSGSSWINNGILYVGDEGTGELTIRNGGTVSNNTSATIGRYAGGLGTVIVDGSGSSWISNGTLTIGNEGTGVLTIRNSGLVNATGGVAVGVNTTGSANLSLTSGGTLQTQVLTAGSGTVTVTFDNGILRALADNASFITGFAPGELFIDAGGLTVDDNGYAIATDSSIFSGVGGLTKTGSGTLTLGGVNTYSGATTITSGTLKAGIAGAFSAPSAYTVGSNATLDLGSHDQRIASLVNSGTVRISSAASANPVGATLTVNGNYLSNGGSLYLRTVLGDDSSPTDRLVADSVTTGANGATRLYVINAGGVGADTSGNGIEVVQVATTSDNNAFILGAPVTAGAYEYILSYNANQNWYLTNTDPTGNDESAHDDLSSRLAGMLYGGVLYNPNIGSYLGNQYAAASMFHHNVFDRKNSPRSPDRTLWARTSYNTVKSDLLGSKQEVDIKTGILQIGADLLQHDRLVAGVYGGYGHSKVDNTSRQTGTTANGTVNGYHLGVYGNWTPERNEQNHNKGLYVDGWAYYAWYNNKLAGNAQYSQTKYNSTGYAVSSEVGYGFELWQQGTTSWILQPHAQVSYTHISADSFTDSHGTRYSNNQSSGWQTRLGARLHWQQIADEYGINPFIEANWLHNTLNNGVSLNGVAMQSDIGKNAGELKLGFRGQVNESLSAWSHVGMTYGRENFKRYELQLGMGWQW
ncbi:autotransporter outer membrane beta-barrel domain-containing protein [Saezia sanguinis]|uniref:autotransporter outer membrane beta-barrel domain-containing protein n=1 Tax=Saezia sanguinis TaxID=1965230 RepID=UPI0030313788